MWEIAICFVLLGDVPTPTPKTDTNSATREVEDLARRYRIRAYNEFRAQRDVYDRWATAGRQLLDFARSPSSDASQQQIVADWFRVALKPSTTVTDLPVIPLAAKAYKTPVSETAEQSTQTFSTSAPAHSRSSLPWGARAADVLGEPPPQ